MNPNIALTALTSSPKSIPRPPFSPYRHRTCLAFALGPRLEGAQSPACERASCLEFCSVHVPLSFRCAVGVSCVVRHSGPFASQDSLFLKKKALPRHLATKRRYSTAQQ